MTIWLGMRARCYVLLGLLELGWCLGTGFGFGTFGFHIHHRYSDPVKGIIAVDDLPEKGSANYFSTMAHRDRIIRGRRLAGANDQTPVTFLDGNATARINSLGFLHYAYVSVGTPPLSFLVALDTGSDLFWLPCDCTSCVSRLTNSRGQETMLNIYSPNTSSTSSNVPCNSTMCGSRRQCSARNNCHYQVIYLSNGTASRGFLVEDSLHLISDNEQAKDVDARITFGCGQEQTGSFLDGAAPNGLFGLGMESISVPSVLARENIAANSFSMCFGPDGIGRITFGDKGSSDQGKTPFNIRQSHPTYNISINQISVGGNTQDLEFNAIFDSGTSFTYLNDPPYTLMAESFKKLARDKRLTSSSDDLPFEYCFEASSNSSYPLVNLTMKGGDQFYVNDPIVQVFMKSGDFYCLGVVKSGDLNIIGQNFMTGYRIAFDREKMELGWKESDCYDIQTSTTTLPVRPPASAVTPATAVNPEATAGSTNASQFSGASSPRSMSSFPHPLVILLITIFGLI